MVTALKNSDDRLERNANEETSKKEQVLRDLTDSLMRVVSGRPSRKNSGELKALKAALSGGKGADKAKKATGGSKGRSKSAPKKSHKREEEVPPTGHNASKRTRTGK